MLGQRGAWSLRRAQPGVLVPLLVSLASCVAPGDAGEATDRTARAVLPGIDVLLADSLHLVRGLRVGLITNHTGIDAEGVATIDRLHSHPEIELVALYSPEHGIRGTAEAGVAVESDRDAATNLPIHSLYGATLAPTPELLEGVEILVFDIQDIGTRYYTYIYTMALAMDAAGREGIPFLVLDRPNPLGGTLVQGNVLEPEFASFVGLYSIPTRHGMTPGELARLFVAEFDIEVELHVAPLRGWTREMLFPATGLPWRPPSPNMPDLESALHYPGTCLFEGTGLSVGRGTDRAFQWVGAPGIDEIELARRMSGEGLDGVVFHPARFTPRNPGDGKFDGVEVRGVRLEVTDPNAYDPVRAGVALLLHARAISGSDWEWRSDHFDRLAGTLRLRSGVESGESVDQIVDGWAGELDTFERIRSEHLLYP